MTGLVNAVRDRLEPKCLVNGGLKKDGCKVSMAHAPQPRLVVDFDKPGSPLGADRTRCDYLFIAEDNDGLGWIAPLELKRGRLYAKMVVGQLQAGASAAEKFVPADAPVRFRPVAASGSVSKAERDVLRKKGNKVRFYGHVEAVRLMSCGAPLTGALCA